MAISTSTANASGTVSSVNGTTFTASSATFVAGHVGRAIYMQNGDAKGQTRVITGYTSSTVVTVDHAWDDSPIDGITEDEPSNGDTFLVSWTFDDLDDGSNLVKHDSNMFELTSTWSVSNAFVYDTNITFKCNGENLNFSTSACLRLGDKVSHDFSSNGCHIFDTNSSLIAWDPGSSGGDIQLYGGTFHGSSVSSFWRMQANGMARWCDIVQYGPHGMRLTGAKSCVLNYTVVGNEATFSPFTVAGTFGLIENIRCFDGNACLYWQSGTPGGAATLKNVRAQNLQGGFFQYRPLSDTKLTIEGVEVSEIEAAPAFGSYISGGPSAFEVSVKNNVIVNVNDSSGNTLSGARTYIENSDGTEQLNDTGQISQTSIEIRAFDVPSGSSRSGLTWNAASGDSFTPMTVRTRKYSYQPFETSWDGRSSLTTFNFFLLDDDFVDVVEATASAYTGITINGVTETIVISEDHTLQEIYDYCQWWATESGNIQYEVPITTADGINFSVASGWDFTVNGTYTVTATDQTLALSGGGAFTISGDFTGVINDGTNFRVPVNVTNIVSGSRLYIERDSDGAVLNNSAVSGTSETIYQSVTAATAVTVRLRSASGATKYRPFETGGTITTTAGLSLQAAQQLDE
jgi:hypothetical protein